MCKITSMELYGTELDMPVVRDFELWFQTARSACRIVKRGGCSPTT
jgi:hypothetical protein